MKIELKGKKAVVCGSTQGIGKAIALAMAEAGAEIILKARNEEKLKAVKAELSLAEGQKHDFIVADFSEPEKLKSNLGNFFKNSDKVHILVNNTGGPAPSSIMEASPSDFSEAFSKHLICNQLLVQALVPLMKNASYGRVTNIISTSVKEPIIGLGVSNTVRLAVASWSKTLSHELAPYGITVNNILPGYTRTARLHALIEQRALKSGKSTIEIEAEMLKEIPAGRFAESAELAALAVFLASPYAGYINGVNIQVDGGKTKCF